MMNYESTNGCLPPGFKGSQYGTWAIWIMPYIELSASYNAWNQVGNNSNPATSLFQYLGAANTTVCRTTYKAYLCPSDTSAGFGLLAGGDATPGRGSHVHNYVVNFGNTDVWQGPSVVIPSPVVPGLNVTFNSAPFHEMVAPSSTTRPRIPP